MDRQTTGQHPEWLVESLLASSKARLKTGPTDQGFGQEFESPLLPWKAIHSRQVTTRTLEKKQVVFRPSAAVSQNGLLESCTRHHNGHPNSGLSYWDPHPTPDPRPQDFPPPDPEPPSHPDLVLSCNGMIWSRDRGGALGLYAVSVFLFGQPPPPLPVYQPHMITLLWTNQIICFRRNNPWNRRRRDGACRSGPSWQSSLSSQSSYSSSYRTWNQPTKTP